MFPELKRLIEQMGKDMGIEKEVIIEALESAILTAARKKLGAKVELESRYNEEAGELEVFQFKPVVETVVDSETEISLEQAKTDQYDAYVVTLGSQLKYLELDLSDTAIEKLKSTNQDLRGQPKELQSRVGVFKSEIRRYIAALK